MNSPHLPPAILIMGPTASGKTAVAMALAGEPDALLLDELCDNTATRVAH